ncbi:MAG: signal peptidase II [Armatimonadetes bacterium]|nr:signal peptidase II [Armatimonadota bacterium]
MTRHPGRCFVLIALAWAALDQVTKLALLHRFHRTGPWVIHIVKGWLDINILTFNPGAAFGILRDAAWSRWLFVVIAAATIVAMIVWRRSLAALPAIERFGLALVAGGAAGNLIDRLLRGGQVIDFIHFQIRRIGFVWPDFNVADIGVTCGMTIYVAHVFFAGRARTAEPAADDDA